MPQFQPMAVTVYNYWLANGEDMHSTVSPEKAPLDVIVNDLRCTPLLGTAQQVMPEELDGNRRLRRRPTGWAS